MIVCSDELSKMDAQHRQLSELTRAACHTLENENSPTEFRGTLSRLLDFTVVHFTEEENLMRCLSYKGLKSHKRTHAILLSRRQSMRKSGWCLASRSGPTRVSRFRSPSATRRPRRQRSWSIMRRHCSTGENRLRIF